MPILEGLPKSKTRPAEDAEGDPTAAGRAKKKRLRAQLTDPLTGKRVNVYAPDEAGLEHRKARLAAIRDDFRAGVISKAEAGKMSRPLHAGPLTMTVAFERYIQTQMPESQRIARSNWKARLKKWFADKAPEELTREAMARWESQVVRAGHASKTIKNTYDQIAACCRMLVDSGELPSLPWGDRSKYQGGSGWRPAKVVAKKQRRAAATLAQLTAFIGVAAAEDRTHWARGEYADRSILLTVMFLVGLRQAEACALAWDLLSLDTEPPILRIAYQAKRGWRSRTSEDRPREPTKTRSERSHHLHPSVVQALKYQRAELARRGWYRPDGPVFPGIGGNFRTSGSVIKPQKMKDYAKAAGFPFWQDWVTHSTKHSFATLEAIASGGNLKRTQARTGHADVRQLENYLHDAGHFLGSSAIPAIEVEPPVVLALPGGVGDVVAADPWGFEQVPTAPDLSRVDGEAASKWVDARKAQRAAERERLAMPYAELAREWLASGVKTRSGLPPEVIKQGDLAAARNFRKAQRAGESPARCASAARHARKCVQGAWIRELKKAMASKPPGPVPAPAAPDPAPPVYPRVFPKLAARLSDKP